MPSVLQDWVTELPLMMQGTMMTGIRGNDLAHAPKMKPVIRWMRQTVLVNGNPENDFMTHNTHLPTVEDFEDELEYLSVHYFRHFLLTLEIIGYKHPDFEISDIAMDYYLRLVNWCHLAPESHEELDERLSGKPGTTGDSKLWESPGLVTSKKRLPKPHQKGLQAKMTQCQTCGMPTDISNPYCSNCGSDWSKMQPVPPPAALVPCINCGVLVTPVAHTCVHCKRDTVTPHKILRGMGKPKHQHQGGGAY